MSAKTINDLDLIRSVMEELTAKWALLILSTLCDGPARFNALRRANPGISQKALTQCLRRLEGAGLISRTVVSTAPVAVQYEVTPLGASLEPHTSGILEWARRNRDTILSAREAFADRSSQ